MAMDITSVHRMPGTDSAAKPDTASGSGAAAKVGKHDLAARLQAIGREQAAREKVPVQEDELSSAVSDINEYLQSIHRELEFNIDDDTGRTVIKVISPESDEVIRQIPAEEVLALARFVREQQGQSDGGIIIRAQA